MIASAKSLGAGMPIGAITGRAEIMDSAHLGGVGSTYGGSPLACVAALEALKMIQQPEFLAHANRLGDVMREVLEGWKRRFPIVGDVRGLGPMMLVELVTDRESKTPLVATDTLAVVRHAVAWGPADSRPALQQPHPLPAAAQYSGRHVARSLSCGGWRD